jgi:hypothetical protein
MRRLLLIAPVILICCTMAACAPGGVFGPAFTPTPTSTITPTPTATPTPSPAPLPTDVLGWKDRAAAILTANGFVHSPDQESACPSPCSVYANTPYGEMAAVFDDGSFVYGTSASQPTSSMGSVVSAILGEEFGQWMDQQTELPAFGKIKGYTVSLSFTEIYGGRFLVFYLYVFQ